VQHQKLCAATLKIMYYNIEKYVLQHLKQYYCNIAKSTMKHGNGNISNHLSVLQHLKKVISTIKIACHGT
jgi:hypothetical protein